MRQEEAGAGADSAGQSELPPRQTDVYRKYLQLYSIAARQFHDSLAGKLMMRPGFHGEGAEWALATTIAGGAFLGIEPNPQRLKAAVRNGSCDFMVNTLDEALRVLKNELRQRKPLSVGLLGQAWEIFPAMVERGVQPDLVADILPWEATPEDSNPAGKNLLAGTAAHRHAIDPFLERGAAKLDARATGDVDSETASSARFKNRTKDSVPTEAIWTTANFHDMRSMDQAVLAWLEPGDQLRRRWLERAPAYFYRQIPLERVLGVELEELPDMIEAFRNAGSLQAPATVRWLEPGGVPRSITV